MIQNILKKLTIATLLTTSINFAIGSEFSSSAGFDPFENDKPNTALSISYNKIKDSTKGRGLIIKQKLIEENLFDVMGGDPDKSISFTGLSVGDLKNRGKLDAAIGSLGEPLSHFIQSRFRSLDEIIQQDLNSQIRALRDSLPPLYSRDQLGKRERDGNGDPIIIPDQFMYDVSETDLANIRSPEELRILVARIEEKKRPITITRDEYNNLKYVRSKAIEEAIRLEEYLKDESLPSTFISDLIDVSEGILTGSDAIGEDKTDAIRSLFTKVIGEYERVRRENFLRDLLESCGDEIDTNSLGPVIDPPFDNIKRIVEVLALEIEDEQEGAKQFMEARNKAREAARRGYKADGTVSYEEVENLIRSKDAQIEELSVELTRLMTAVDYDFTPPPRSHTPLPIYRPIMSAEHASDLFDAGLISMDQLDNWQGTTYVDGFTPPQEVPVQYRYPSEQHALDAADRGEISYDDVDTGRWKTMK